MRRLTVRLMPSQSVWMQPVATRSVMRPAGRRPGATRPAVMRPAPLRRVAMQPAAVLLLGEQPAGVQPPWMRPVAIKPAGVRRVPTRLAAEGRPSFQCWVQLRPARRRPASQESVRPGALRCSAPCGRLERAEAVRRARRLVPSPVAGGCLRASAPAHSRAGGSQGQGPAQQARRVAGSVKARSREEASPDR